MVKIFSFTCETAGLKDRRTEQDDDKWTERKEGSQVEESEESLYLWSSGMSGLCLNREEVLMLLLPDSLV